MIDKNEIRKMTNEVLVCSSGLEGLDKDDTDLRARIIAEMLSNGVRQLMEDNVLIGESGGYRLILSPRKRRDQEHVYFLLRVSDETYLHRSGEHLDRPYGDDPETNGLFSSKEEAEEVLEKFISREVQGGSP